MKNKKVGEYMKKILVILTIIIIGIGGYSIIDMKNNRNSQLSVEEIEQERMAKYLYNSYENIKKIEFTTFNKNNSTGTWTANAIVNDAIYVTFGIDRIGEDSDISFGQHISQSGGQELVRKNTISNNFSSESVTVIYFNGGNE